MILANLTKAIREQNWFAVAVEFLIVIAGVVIGFQLQNWNQLRLERQEDARVEREALERLLAETETNVGSLHYEKAFLDDFMPYREAFAGFLSSAVDTEYTEAALRIGHRSMTFGRLPRLADTVFTELSADGSMAKIQDVEIRASLAEFRSDIEYYIDTQQRNTLKFDTMRALLFPDARLVFDPENAEDVGMRDRFRYDINWQALRENDQAIEAVNQVLSLQLLLSDRLENVVDESEELCERLAQALGKDCNPPRLEDDRDLPPLTLDSGP